jgi:hypothetical protein
MGDMVRSLIEARLFVIESEERVEREKAMLARRQGVLGELMKRPFEVFPEGVKPG